MRSAHGALWAGLFVHGVVTMLLGPLIPEMRGPWGVSRAELALLFPAQFVASSVGAVLSSLRPRWSLICGYSSMSVGLAALAWLPWPMPLVGFAVIGFGLGLVAPATNLRVARQSGPGGAAAGRRGSDLSLLNMLWGVGAVACPLVFAAAEGRLSARWILVALAVLVAVPGLLLISLPPLTRHGEPTECPVPGVPPRFVAAGLLPMAGLFFLYVGVEATLGGWLVVYAESWTAGGHGSSPVPLLIGSGFWAALLVGRGAAPWVLRRVSEPRVYVAAILVSVAGAVGLRFATSEWLMAASSLVLGFGLAPVFPLLVSFVTEQTEKSGARQTGWVFASAGLGGASLPWITARLPAPDAGLAQGFMVPIVALTLMLLLFAAQRMVIRDPAPTDC